MAAQLTQHRHSALLVATLGLCLWTVPTLSLDTAALNTEIAHLTKLYTKYHYRVLFDLESEPGTTTPKDFLSMPS